MFSKLLLKYIIISIPLYAATILLIDQHKQRQYDNQVHALTERTEYEVVHSAEHLSGELDSALTDLLFLAEGLDYEQLNKRGTLQQIKKTYFELSRITHKYDQIRFLNTAGQELIPFTKTFHDKHGALTFV